MASKPILGVDLQQFPKHFYFFIRPGYRKSLGVVALKHFCTLMIIIFHIDFEIPWYDGRSILSYESAI